MALSRTAAGFGTSLYLSFHLAILFLQRNSAFDFENGERAFRMRLQPFGLIKR